MRMFQNQFIRLDRNRKFLWASCCGGVLILVLNTFSLIADQSIIFSTPAAGTNAMRGAGDEVSATNSALDATNLTEALDDDYKLAIGDRLSFKIVEDNEDSKPLQVTDSGDIEFPYIGRLPATGKTCKELADELKAQYEKDYYKQATVIVAVDLKAHSQGKIYLVGPVGAPGPQDIPSDEKFTLSKAILRAGGFTDFADQHHVRVTRKASGGGTNETFVVDVSKILGAKGRTDLDLVLESGDLVFIPEKWIRF